MKTSSATLLLITVITSLILIEKSKLRRCSRKAEIQALIDNLEKLGLAEEELVKQRDRLKDIKDSLSEMSEDDMFFLQQLMNQQARLKALLSNVMKTASEVQNVIVGNLKA